MPRNPNCELCELHRSSKNVCIWGDGDGEAFVIGEAPGKAEAKTGRPFMGESGQLLRGILTEHGLDDAYITNVAKCRPPDNRKPEPEELAACRPYLDEEIATRKPKAILLLGATAMKAILHRTKITEMNGQVVDKDGQKYVCSFHPAFILRDPSKEPQLRMAIKRYADVMNDTAEVKMPEYQVIHKPTMDEFLEAWEMADEVAFDCETTGLDWWTDGFDINSIQFSLRIDQLESNWVLPMAKWPVLPREQRRELLHWLSKNTKGKRMIAQNGKFDNLCLMAVFDVRFRLDSDTGLAHHLIDENSAHGLKPMARAYLGAPDYDLTLRQKLNPKDRKKFFGYGAADTAYTRRLDHVFRKKMDDDEEWLYNKIVMPSARAFEAIERNGLYVDVEKMNLTEKQERKTLIEVERKLNKAAGKVINWNKPEEVSEFLYGKLGLQPAVFTPKGFASTGEEALSYLDHPTVKQLVEYREKQKFLSTYIGEAKTNTGGWRDFMVGPHLFLSTKLHGTVTGRYSSRLHQVPRDGTVRNLVIAPEGWTFCQLDLDQAELRTIAIDAREPEMLHCFKNGIDIHWRTLIGAVESGGGEYVQDMVKLAKSYTKRKAMEFPTAIEIARDMTPEEAIAIWSGWKEARKKAKGINFGFVFDQSPEGFITYAKTKYGFEPTLEESTRFQDGFFHTYRGIRPWHERKRKLAHQDGFVRSMFGRKRRLPGINGRDRFIISECERQAINAPIQGFIGDYKACILIELDEAFTPERLRIVGEVHDSILMWVKNEHLKTVMPEVKERAENPRIVREAGLKFPIPFTVSLELGPWGAGKSWRP